MRCLLTVSFDALFVVTPLITTLGQESTPWTHLWSAKPGLFGATALLTGTEARWEGEGRGAKGQAGPAHGAQEGSLGAGWPPGAPGRS